MVKQVLFLAFVLAAPALSARTSIYAPGSPSAIRSGAPSARSYSAPPAPGNIVAVVPAAYADLAALEDINKQAQPVVDQTEALADAIFPADGQPIVQGNVIRTQFGNAPLPVNNALNPGLRAELSTLAYALNQVVSSPTVDANALNTLLEMSRDMQLNFPATGVANGAELSDLAAIIQKAVPLVDATEAISDDIFPNDGQPIVQDGIIRTKYGNAPLPVGNVLDPQVRAELSELAIALASVVDTATNDSQAINKVLELSRNIQLSYN